MGTMCAKRLAALLGCGIWICATAAIEAPEVSGNSGSPYQGIIERNVFGLKPPPPPPPPAEPPKAPAPKIMLTGIITMFEKPLALLKVTPPPKPGSRVDEESMTLGINERQNNVTVLEIDAVNKIVKVDDYGTITNLNFENNGVKVATVAPPPAGAPGAPPNPGVFNPAGPNMPAHNPGVRALPTNNRQVRTPPGSAGNTPGGAAYGTPGYGGTGGVTLPGLGSPASPVTASQSWPPETTDPDHQALLDAAYQMKYQKEIQAGKYPDVPGPSLLNEGTGAAQQQPTAPGLPRAPSLPRTFPLPAAGP